MARRRRLSHLEALNEAIYRFGPPDIVKSDQGPRFTSFAWPDRRRRSGIRIPMDGKGRYFDNIFIERLWRTLNRRSAQRDTSAAVCPPDRQGHRPARVSGHGWNSAISPAAKALCGRPPAVGCSITAQATQPDQQEQIKA